MIDRLRIILAAACVAALAACGGGDEPAPWQPVGGDVTGAVCPADLVTFVGPVLPQCLPQGRA